MSNRWLAALAVLAACGPSRPDRAEIVIEDQVRWQPPSLPLPPPPMQQDDPPPPPPPPQQPKAKPPKACLDGGSLTSFEVGRVLRACFDQDSDGTADRCVRWSLDGRPLAYDPAVDDAQDVTEADEAEEPVTFHSDSQNNDDGRIELEGNAVQICAYERACAKLMPRLGDDLSMTEIYTDAEYHRAAITMPSHDTRRGHVELWDLDRGRVYARLPFRGLMSEIDYTFSIKLGRGALIALASSNIESAVSGAIYGLDGGFRGMLAGGARSLELGEAIETIGQFVILEEQPDKKPYVLHAVDLATGAQGRFSIARADEGAAWIELRKLRPGVVSTVQWGKRLRLDVIDLRARAQRTLWAKGC
ncbi:MAG TPA: hypothetical protein VNO30_36930 [Kofleriaceae bacterium]|nr:hypothetical protein [Kofleriaceae bacterium]